MSGPIGGWALRAGRNPPGAPQSLPCAAPRTRGKSRAACTRRERGGRACRHRSAVAKSHAPAHRSAGKPVALARWSGVRAGPCRERARGMTRAVRQRCGRGASARGIGACSRQPRCQQSVQEQSVFASLLRVRVRKSPRESARASLPTICARFMPLRGRTSGPRRTRRVPAFTPSAPTRVLGGTIQPRTFICRKRWLNFHPRHSVSLLLLYLDSRESSA